MTLHLLGPTGLADPARPSGGNVYDVRLAAALRTLGREVTIRETGTEGLGTALADLPDGAVAVVDGLVGCASPAAMEAERSRLRTVMIVHLPLGVAVPGVPATPEPEARALAAATAVVCTSGWTRDWLSENYGLPDRVLHVVPPGVEKATSTEPSAPGHRLLSVGAVTPVKGHDVLVDALATLDDLRWTWTLVGASVDAEHATALWSTLCDAGLDHRVTLAGALTGPDLAAAYGLADLVVLPSRHETYGMVATEALARGVPVLASDVGGMREAVGSPLPGLLVRPDDVGALAAALRRWLTEPRLRAQLRARAAERRTTLAGWDRTAVAMAQVLDSLDPAGRGGRSGDPAGRGGRSDDPAGRGGRSGDRHETR